MKIKIIYPHVVGSADAESKGPAHYAPYTARFFESFAKFQSGVEATPVAVLCGPQINLIEIASFVSCASNLQWEFRKYEGIGYDLGCHQSTASELDCDIAVSLVTHSYFREENWLVPIVEAFEKYGDGLYGTSASYQNTPHIRTGCFAYSPATMRQYPWQVNTREDGFLFESGMSPSGAKDPSRSFTNWMLLQGKPVKMVTRDGCYDLADWRKPDNIFRRGDQGNSLAFDRHFDIYAESTPEEKTSLEILADTK